MDLCWCSVLNVNSIIPESGNFKKICLVLNLIYKEMMNKDSTLMFMNCSNSHPESKWELKINSS